MSIHRNVHWTIVQHFFYRRPARCFWESISDYFGSSHSSVELVSPRPCSFVNLRPSTSRLIECLAPVSSDVVAIFLFYPWGCIFPCHFTSMHRLSYESCDPSSP
ncbi:unnamed protein product, partial [Choristocarpus tenellus]